MPTRLHAKDPASDDAKGKKGQERRESEKKGPQEGQHRLPWNQPDLRVDKTETMSGHGEGWEKEIPM